MLTTSAQNDISLARSDCDFSKAILKASGFGDVTRGKFHNAVVQRCTFVGDFSGADFTGAALEGASFCGYRSSRLHYGWGINLPRSLAASLPFHGGSRSFSSSMLALANFAGHFLHLPF